MEICNITRDKFRYLRKHRINLETRFNLKIILPETFNQSVTLANGTKENINKLKNLLQKGNHSINGQHSDEIMTITLSDSEADSPEVPKPKKNKKRKRKVSMVTSTPVADQGYQSPKQTPVSSSTPKNKRLKSGPILQESNFIPLTVTSTKKGNRFVKMKKKKTRRPKPQTSNQPINDNPFFSPVSRNTRSRLTLVNAGQDGSPNGTLPSVSTNVFSFAVASSTSTISGTITTSTLDSTATTSQSAVPNPFCLGVSSKSSTVTSATVDNIPPSGPESTSVVISDSVVATTSAQTSAYLMSIPKSVTESTSTVTSDSVVTPPSAQTSAYWIDNIPSSGHKSTSADTSDSVITLPSAQISANLIDNIPSSENKSTSADTSDSVTPGSAQNSAYLIVSEDEDCVILEDNGSLKENDISVIVLDDSVAESPVANQNNSVGTKAIQDMSNVTEEVDDSIIILDEISDVNPLASTSSRQKSPKKTKKKKHKQIRPRNQPQNNLSNSSGGHGVNSTGNRRSEDNIPLNNFNNSSEGHGVNSTGNRRNEDNFIPLNNFNNVRPRNFNQLHQPSNFRAVAANFAGAYNSAFSVYSSQSSNSCVSLANFNFSGGQSVNPFPVPNYSAVVPRPQNVSLRPIVIDGSNVAREHGKPTGTFSCKGIQISVEYFLKRGHTKVTVFIPKFRRYQTNGPFPTTDGEILDQLEKRNHLIFSPSRRVEGRLMSCYDDRFIVQLASQNGGVILSNDNYKDIMVESEEFRRTIKERLLMFCFADDLLMIPEDPLGRHGPRLQQFLQFPPNMP